MLLGLLSIICHMTVMWIVYFYRAYLPKQKKSKQQPQYPAFYEGDYDQYTPVYNGPPQQQQQHQQPPMRRGATTTRSFTQQAMTMPIQQQQHHRPRTNIIPNHVANELL